MLRIMKDSRIGAMGVTAVVCLLLLKFASLSSLPLTLFWQAALLMPLAGRCALVFHLVWLPYARPQGLGPCFLKPNPSGRPWARAFCWRWSASFCWESPECFWPDYVCSRPGCWPIFFPHARRSHRGHPGRHLRNAGAYARVIFSRLDVFRERGSPVRPAAREKFRNLEKGVPCYLGNRNAAAVVFNPPKPANLFQRIALPSPCALFPWPRASRKSFLN